MVERFDVAIANALLAADRAGEGSPVVFLHAGVADRRMWRPQTAKLASSYQTIAYDRRGFGETKSPDEAFSQIGDLSVLLDQLGIARAALVGCSQGGRVVIDFSLAFPQRVSQLILIAPTVSGATSPDAYPPGLEELDEEMDEADETGDLRRINEIEAILWLDGPAGPEGRVSGRVRDLFLDMNGIALALPDLEQEIEPPSAYEHVFKLDLPTLVLWGDRDFPHLQERCSYLVQTIPGARGVEIPGTAHLPNLEQPARVNDLLADFLTPAHENGT